MEEFDKLLLQGEAPQACSAIESNSRFWHLAAAVTGKQAEARLGKRTWQNHMVSLCGSCYWTSFRFLQGMAAFAAPPAPPAPSAPLAPAEPTAPAAPASPPAPAASPAPPAADVARDRVETARPTLSVRQGKVQCLRRLSAWLVLACSHLLKMRFRSLHIARHAY